MFSCDFSNNKAEKCELKQRIENLFTEKSPALHTALRSFNKDPLWVNQVDIKQEIADSLEKVRQFSEDIRQKKRRGITGQPIKDVVNIGIGGSQLGPLMTTHALSAISTQCGHW